MSKPNRESYSLIKSLRGQLFEIDTRLSTINLHSEINISFNSSNRGRKRTPILPSLPEKQEKTLKARSAFENSLVFHSIDPTSSKEQQFLQKYFNLSADKRKKGLKKSRFTLSKPKYIRSNPKILPRATRLDPISNPVQLSEEDLQKGIYSLVNLGLVSKNSEIFETLYKENPPLMHNKVLFHDFSFQFENIKSTKHMRNCKESSSLLQPDIIPVKTPALAVLPQDLEPPTVLLTIQNGLIQRDESFSFFCSTPNHSQALIYLKQLESLCKNYSLPHLSVYSDKLFSLCQPGILITEVMKTVENWQKIKEEIQRIDFETQEKLKRSKAALMIQCSWRRFKGAARMRRHRIEKKNIDIIQIHYKAYRKRVFTKEFAGTLRTERSKKFQIRQEWLADHWDALIIQHNTEIHIGSDLAHSPQANNLELSRIFLLTNPKISMIYISLTELDLEVISYYRMLMDILNCSVEDRLEFVIPTTLCKTFMINAAKALYLSSSDLVDLKHRNINKSLLHVPYQTTEYDEYVSDFLKVPILGCVASVYQDSTIVRRREILVNAGLKVIPGFCGVFSYKDFCVELDILSKNEDSKEWEVFVKGVKLDKISEWESTKEVLVRKEQFIDVVSASFFIDPKGRVKYHSSVKLVGSPEFAAIYPHNIFSEHEIKTIISQLSVALFNEKIIGYVSVKLTKAGIVDFGIGVSPHHTIHLFVHNLLKGAQQDEKYYVSVQENSELEQEKYLDDSSNFITYENFKRKTIDSIPENRDCLEERNYIWIPNIHHEDLKGFKIESIFHMCRLEAVLFSMPKNEGTIFLPYSSFDNGCVGILAIAPNTNLCLQYLARGMFILNELCYSKKNGNINFIAQALQISNKISAIKKLSANKKHLVNLIQ